MKLRLMTYSILFSLGVQAQDFYSDYKNMIFAYKTIDTLYAEINSRVYSGPNVGSPIMSNTYVLKKCNHNYYSKAEGIVTIFQDTVGIIVNPSFKTITYTTITDSLFNQASNFLNMNIDSLINTIDSIEYNGISGSCNTYTMLAGEQYFEKVVFNIDTNNYLINKIIYNYNKSIAKVNYVVEIDYSVLDLHKKFTDEEFSFDEYIIIDSVTIKPTSAYYDYKIIKK